MEAVVDCCLHDESATLSLACSGVKGNVEWLAAWDLGGVEVCVGITGGVAETPGTVY